MYICTDCKYIFEEFKTFHGESLEYFGHNFREKWKGCPRCSSACVEMFKCDCCGEYIINEYIKTYSDYKICKNCYIVKNILED